VESVVNQSCEFVALSAFGGAFIAREVSVELAAHWQKSLFLFAPVKHDGSSCIDSSFYNSVMPDAPQQSVV
jgi:hypothetical protein